MNSNCIMPANIEAESHLAAIINSSDDAIISKDLNGNITSWNQAAEKIFGYMASEVIGKHISIIIPSEYLSEEDYIIGQIRQGNKVDHFEAIRRSKQGKTLTLSITVSPIRDKDGNIVGASKVARDITKLKEAERASAYLSAIIESSDDAIISKDLNGFITSWNKAAKRIFGYDAKEIVGRHITMIIPTDILDEEDRILTTLKTGNRIDHYETVRRHKNGNLVPISLTVSPIRDSAGNIIGASKVARDISYRIQAEKAIEEASIKKDEFLAHMSHELRTPMNAVIGLSYLLKAMDLPEKARKYVETLHVSAENLLDLINDMLDFAKIDSGSIELEEVEFNLAEQVEKAISVTNVKAHEKNLSLYVNYSNELNHYYMGDPLRIHQILMNLLSNAVKFTDQGSIKVDISGAANKKPDIIDITIKVIDSGIGIPPEKLPNIFDKFMQADSSIARRFGGSGLGLAISKAFTEKMGGTIQVNSEVGVGTTFIVTIPLKTTKRHSPIEKFSANKSPKEQVIKKNILLVEDYEPNVLVASAMLDAMVYKYDVAYNGLEALRKFVYGNYDVILMDVQMPDLDGIEATKRIRKIEAEKSMPRTPIVAMTAHVREQDKEKCLAAGMDDFISKPFNPAELAQLITRYISLNAEIAELESVARRENNIIPTADS